MLGLEGQKNVRFGKPSPAQEQCDSFDVDICPDLVLAAAAAFGAAAFLALYIAITTNANGRRRKRSAGGEGITPAPLSPSFIPYLALQGALIVN